MDNSQTNMLRDVQCKHKINRLDSAHCNYYVIPYMDSSFSDKSQMRHIDSGEILCSVKRFLTVYPATRVVFTEYLLRTSSSSIIQKTTKSS